MLRRSGGSSNGAAPLAPVLAVSALSSFGTGAITLGIAWVAKELFKYGDALNSSLQLLVGATYIAAALLVAPTLRRVILRRPGVSERGALLAILSLLGVCCAIPMVWREAWALWLFVGVYTPLTGAMWPIVEGYLSGGRGGVELRRAIGHFNVVWSSAVAIAFLAMGPLLKSDPVSVIAVSGLLHVASLAAAAMLPRAPGAHPPEERRTRPRVYAELLVVFRGLLILSYVLIAGVSPLLPQKMEVFDLDTEWEAPLVASWTLARVGAFALFQRWHGWHGKRRTPVWTGALMLGGFAGALLAQSLGALLVSLAALGVGVGGVYCAAFYYVMEVGTEAVDAGSKHEATIGVGYALGPLTALAPWLLVDAGRLEASAAYPVTVALIGLIAAVVVCLAVWRVLRGRARAKRETRPPE